MQLQQEAVLVYIIAGEMDGFASPESQSPKIGYKALEDLHMVFQ